MSHITVDLYLTCLNSINYLHVMKKIYHLEMVLLCTILCQLSIPEMEENFQKKTVGQSNIPTLLYEREPNQRDSAAYSDSGSWNMRRVPSQLLPDNRSQFEHQLEAYKLQVDMNGKIDKMLGLLEEKEQPKSRQTKPWHDDAMLKTINKDPQFV